MQNDYAMNMRHLNWILTTIFWVYMSVSSFMHEQIYESDIFSLILSFKKWKSHKKHADAYKYMSFAVYEPALLLIFIQIISRPRYCGQGHIQGGLVGLFFKKFL